MLNLTSLKTPGVYIDEISRFPPSIAAVETAIPAFIGYTARATKNGESVLAKAVAIDSIAEYEEIYGGGPPQTVEVYLDNNDQYLNATSTAGYFLYDSLRMFYANGGGKCYIISIGIYQSPIVIDIGDFNDGLAALQKEDEPTIIVAPDAVQLAGNGLFDFQVSALQQCAKLMDRVLLCDLRESDETDFDDSVAEFRDNSGINNLKYGAAYAPWINASLPRIVRQRNLTLRRTDAAGPVIPLNTLTTNAGILQILTDLSLSQGAVNTSNTGLAAIAGAGNSLDDALKTVVDVYNNSADTTLATLEPELQGIYGLLAEALEFIADFHTSLPTPVPAPAPGQTKDFNLRGNIEQMLTASGIKAVVDRLAAHHNQLGAIDLFDNVAVDLDDALPLLGYADVAAFEATTFASLVIANPYTGVADEEDQADIARDGALRASGSIIALFNSVMTAAAEYERTFDDSLQANFGFYKNIVSRAAEKLNLMPPSGAIAGIYAAVDASRGVWKAPANVSLTAVTKPAVKISHEEQMSLNVDVNSGKSINAIRSFTGKGTLVWGARTLAGNDNEWRYVSVRRFFNMVEESTKKATEQFVFEPNDANTWVKVQAMIENFLNTLWRVGALQGVKPEHAFYVAVGLGKTMTPLDILEGRMIVEIGMAVVRPAEFIILRFSHKLAES
ncbi:MAG: phage tail sheath subtilisin-like domain-containing protein [Saprospiraceae bacterium]|nr:phage tail sheath subtilisin-like domain-containing protein [Saprospiraceae bacterium]